MNVKPAEKKVRETDSAGQGFMPATTYAVLGLLSFGHDLCGYELRQWALNSLRHFYWSPAQSQIYKELSRLKMAGYITSREVAQEDRPAKTVYAITQSGRIELSRWVEQAPVGPIVLKHPSALRLYFGHMATPARLRDILLEHRKMIDRTLAELESIAVGLDDEPEANAANQVNDWALDIYRSDIAATDRIVEALHKE